MANIGHWRRTGVPTGRRDQARKKVSCILEGLSPLQVQFRYLEGV